MLFSRRRAVAIAVAAVAAVAAVPRSDSDSRNMPMAARYIRFLQTDCLGRGSGLREVCLCS